MSEFKGTPGEWSFSHSSVSDDNVACIEINSSESLHEIAYLQSTPSSIGRYEQTSLDKTIANAHLISAAPELLDACIRMRNQLYAAGYEGKEKSLNPTKELLWQTEQAIAKALAK